MSATGRISARQQGGQLTQWDPGLVQDVEGGVLAVRARQLPGVKLEDVEITLHERLLAESGEREAKGQTGGPGYLVSERRHGTLQWNVVLPHSVDDHYVENHYVEEGEIGARFEGGVLEVGVPGGWPKGPASASG